MSPDIRLNSAQASETALSVASDWTPWAVAAAPALVIGHALSKHDQPWVIVVAVALAVELAGVLAGHTLTEAREHNAVTPRERHRRLWPIGAALMAYAVVSMALSVVLDVWPDLVTYWPVLMSPLAVVVYYVYGERLVIRHTRGQGTVSAPATVQAIQVSPGQLTEPDLPPVPSPAARPATADSADRKAAALVWLAGHPDADEDALVREFNVSPRTARRYLSEARAIPVTVTNGNGHHA